jgi:hypothetical protein
MKCSQHEHPGDPTQIEQDIDWIEFDIEYLERSIHNAIITAFEIRCLFRRR